jgi:uncharacterized protein YlxP (DUF503 family)
MLVAFCQLELIIPGSGSLKEKRFVLSSLKTRIRNKFNVSVAEVEDNDKWQKATLGISMVANERKFLDQVFSHIFNLIEEQGQVEIIQRQLEIF